MPKLTEPLSSVLSEVKKLVTEDAELQKRVEDTEIKLNNKTFKLAIIALVKCGKSTLNNAFLGGQYLPANTIPETSALTSIMHNPSLKEPVLKVYDDRSKELAKTSTAVLNEITEINKAIRANTIIDESLKNLLLEANVTALQGLILLFPLFPLPFTFTSIHIPKKLELHLKMR